MNLIRQFTFQAVREFDEAMLKAIRESRLEDVVAIKHAREEVFNLIDASSGSIERLESSLIQLVSDSRLQGAWAPAAQAVNALSLTASALAAGIQESALDRLAAIDVDEERREPSEVAAEMVHRTMDRVILQMVDASADIGRLRRGIRTANALRDDLVAMIVLESRGDLMQAASLMDRYMNERRTEKLGEDISRAVHRVIEGIRDYAQAIDMQDHLQSSHRAALSMG